jgi:hypothetical protein
VQLVHAEADRPPEKFLHGFWRNRHAALPERVDEAHDQDHFLVTASVTAFLPDPRKRGEVASVHPR